MTLQEEANKQGISVQAVWLKTPKGKAYKKAYYNTDKWRAYRRDYARAFRKRTFVPVKKLRELGLIK
jgi:hypothetical protein